MRAGERAVNWRSQLLVFLLILSACATVPESPGVPGVFRYNHRLFVIELRGVEVFDDEVKLNLMYINLTDGRQFAGIPPGPRGEPAAAYLVDNLGRRYPYRADSFGRARNDFPPRVWEEIWIVFAGIQPGASSFSLLLPWYSAGGTVNITFRGIPLPPPPLPLPGFRYSHRLFGIELKNVELVDDQLRVNLIYTNRSDGPQYAGIALGVFGRPGAYIVDNLGRRSEYVRDSFGRTRSDFPPQAPEDIWITFGKVQPGASSVSLVLPWSTRGAATVTVTFRDIPLSR